MHLGSAQWVPGHSWGLSGRGVTVMTHPPLSSAEVKERVELYFYWLVNSAFNLILEWEIKNLNLSDHSLEKEKEPVIFPFNEIEYEEVKCNKNNPKGRKYIYL
jgi:hypothetical protein